MAKKIIQIDGLAQMFKNKITYIVIIFIILFLNCNYCVKKQSLETNVKDEKISVSVRFSPNGGCQEQIINAINQAHTRVYVQAYSFTALPIAESLIKAKEKNINIIVLLDNSNESSPDSLIPLLQENAILVYLDKAHAIAHNKVMVIDDDTVITGSYNFTKSAEKKNAENCLLIKNKEINFQYFNNWSNHKDHSRLL